MKIRKHALILKRRGNQSSELRKIARIENEALQKILKAFEIVNTNIHTKEDMASLSNCQNYRKRLLEDTRTITYEIFSLNKTALVKDICKTAASKEKWGQLLYYLVKQIDEPTILEIGTNLGISGTYMLEAMGDRKGRLVTMEGLPQLCEIAAAHFSTITSESNFEVVQGLYDDTFAQVMGKDLKYNLIFIDGNHQKEPTLKYFKELKSRITATAIFIFDDIYWSRGMEESWEIIKNDPDVYFSIDLYQQGIVVVSKTESFEKKHFVLHLSY